MPWNPIRILHLSDLHFSESTSWEAESVLGRLAEDVKSRLVASGLKPDLVAVTGDIAFSGKKEEYVLAGSWLRQKLLPAAGRSDDSLIVVPGNHDVDRGSINSVAKFTQDGLLKGNGQKTIADILSDPLQRALLIGRHHEYQTFVNSFRANPTEVPWWSETRTIRGVKIHLAGLDSAWMACGEEDKSHLLLGMWQVDSVLKRSDQSDLVVALMHHPWSYFTDWDVEDTQTEVSRSCGVVLRGHLHRANLENRVSQRGQILELAAGSCFAGSKWLNSYQLLELDPYAGKARVHLRVWDERRRDWIADRLAVEPEGIAEFELRLSPRAPAPPPPKPTPPVTDPSSVSVRSPAPAPSRAALESLKQQVRARADILAAVFREAHGPQAVSQVYVEVRLSGASGPGQIPACFEEDPKDPRSIGRKGELPNAPLRLEEVIEKPHNRWVLLGDPGSGKSTLLHHLVLYLVDETNRVPVFLKVAELCAHPGRALTEIVESVFGAGLVELLIEEIRQKNVVVLLDGLDEALDPREAGAALRRISAEVCGCQLVVASRPVGYQAPSNDFAELTILPLGEQEQRKLLKVWIDDPERVDRELARLRRRPRLRRMAENPLLLTLVGLVMREGHEVPDRQAELYGLAVELLMERSFDPDKPARRLKGPTTASRALGTVALRLHGETGEVYEKGRIVEILEKETRLSETLRQLHGDLDAFLNDVAETTGLIVPVGRGPFAPRLGYLFPHRTFREYLAATALKRDIIDHGIEPFRLEVLRNAVRTDSDPAHRRPLTAEKKSFWGWLFKDLWVRLFESFRIWLFGRQDQHKSLPEAQHSQTELSRVLADGRDRPAQWSEVLALTCGLLGSGTGDALVCRVAEQGRAELVARVVAEAQGLEQQTVMAVLGVEEGRENWQARKKLLEDLPAIVGDLGVAIRLVWRFAQNTTCGIDLWWARDLLRRIARGDLRDPSGEPVIEAVREEAAELAGLIPDQLDQDKRERAKELVQQWLRPIPAGAFLMGSPEGEEGRYNDEGPQHPVTIESGFPIMAVPVTNEMFELFDPGHRQHRALREKVSDEELAHHPVVNVTWWEAMLYAEWVGCRLPLEAEWEHACRSGTTTRYWPGDGDQDLARVGWYSENSGGRTHAVAEKPANPWGLHDVHGNVWEWCLDVWEGDYQSRRDGVVVRPDSPAFDPDPDAWRVVRGGSWNDGPWVARSAYRVNWDPRNEWFVQGFRLVLLPLPPARGS